MSGKKYLTPGLCSSVVEYLTFIAATGEGRLNAIYPDKNVLLSHKMLAGLYQADMRRVNTDITRAHTLREFENLEVVLDRVYTSDFDHMLKLPYADSRSDGDE